jgi:hypothetical protein
VKHRKKTAWRPLQILREEAREKIQMKSRPSHFTVQMTSKTNFEWLAEAVDLWKVTLDEIISEIDMMIPSEKKREKLRKIFEETDSGTMGPKERKTWAKILNTEKTQWERDYQEKLLNMWTYISDLSDRVAKDLTPDEPRWQKVWRK